MSKFEVTDRVRCTAPGKDIDGLVGTIKSLPRKGEGIWYHVKFDERQDVTAVRFDWIDPII